jgi:ribosomal protein S18 acetylase RimI-like enzyme
MNPFRCEPLAEHHERHGFRCGAPELDSYLRERASQDVRRHVAAVFVMVPQGEPHRVAGFYTLSSASVVLKDLPEDFVRKLARYPVVPAVLLGRLARDSRFAGIGKLLLLDALKRAHEHSQAVAAAMVVVDAKDDRAREFYARYGFRQLPGLRSRLFMPMKTIQTLVAVAPSGSG